jgi:hypothetical protein
MLVMVQRQSSPIDSYQASLNYSFTKLPIYQMQAPGALKLVLRRTMTEPTYDELKAKLAELEKQGPKRTGALEFRVGEKGGVSVYGLGRFPVTLYYEQWIRLLDQTEALRKFLEDNKSRLKLKE